MSAAKIIAELNAMLANVPIKTVCIFCKQNSDHRLMFTKDKNTRGVCHVCTLEMCGALVKHNAYTRQEIYKIVDASKNELTE